MIDGTEEQELLRAWLVDHYREVTARPGPDAGIAAAVVVRDVEPEPFLRGTLAFARALPAGAREAWRRAFTRTVFYAGNPDSLPRVDFLHTTADRAIGWVAPADRRATRALSRTLRLFRGGREWPGGRELISVPMPGGNPGGGRAALLRVATAGVGAADYLIHVNHVLAEAVLRGLLRPGDRLDVEHVPHLRMREGYAHARIAQDPEREGQLRLYAALTTQR